MRRGRYKIPTPGGEQALTIISESGLYKLVLRSSKPNARAFQDWVTRDVLPSIRQNGSYVAGQEKVATGEMSEAEYFARAVTAANNFLATLKAENAQLTERVADLAPKAAVADAHFAVNGPVPVARFFRTLAGVQRRKPRLNSNAAKRDLMRLGYLYRTSSGPHGTYRVRSAFRDVLFVEKRQARGRLIH